MPTAKLAFRTDQGQLYANRKPTFNITVGAKVMFDLSATNCEISTVEIGLALTLTFRMVQGQMYICQSNGHNKNEPFYLLTIAKFVLFVAVCEIKHV